MIVFILWVWLASHVSASFQIDPSKTEFYSIQNDLKQHLLPTIANLSPNVTDTDMLAVQSLLDSLSEDWDTSASRDRPALSEHFNLMLASILSLDIVPTAEVSHVTKCIECVEDCFMIYNAMISRSNYQVSFRMKTLREITSYATLWLSKHKINDSERTRCQIRSFAEKLEAAKSVDECITVENFHFLNISFAMTIAREKALLPDLAAQCVDSFIQYVVIEIESSSKCFSVEEKLSIQPQSLQSTSNSTETDSAHESSDLDACVSSDGRTLGASDSLRRGEFSSSPIIQEPPSLTSDPILSPQTDELLFEISHKVFNRALPEMAKDVLDRFELLEAKFSACAAAAQEFFKEIQGFVTETSGAPVTYIDFVSIFGHVFESSLERHLDNATCFSRSIDQHKQFIKDLFSAKLFNAIGNEISLLSEARLPLNNDLNSMFTIAENEENIEYAPLNEPRNSAEILDNPGHFFERFHQYSPESKNFILTMFTRTYHDFVEEKYSSSVSSGSRQVINSIIEDSLKSIK